MDDDQADERPEHQSGADGVPVESSPGAWPVSTTPDEVDEAVRQRVGATIGGWLERYLGQLTDWQRSALAGGPGMVPVGRVRTPSPADWSFTCPVCTATSHHPDDVRYGYCGRCHAYTGDTIRGASVGQVWFDEPFGAGDGQAWVAPAGTPVPRSGRPRPPVWEPVGYVTGDALNVWGEVDREASDMAWSHGWSAGHSTVRFEVVDVDERALWLFYGAALVVPLPWAEDVGRFALPCDGCGSGHRRWTNGYRGGFGWSGLLRRATGSWNQVLAYPTGEGGLRYVRRGGLITGVHDRRLPMRPVTEYGSDVLLDLAAVDVHQADLVRLLGRSWGWHLLAVLYREQLHGTWGTRPDHGWGRGYGKGRRR